MNNWYIIRVTFFPFPTLFSKFFSAKSPGLICKGLTHLLTLSQIQILASSKFKDFADKNFEFK